MTGGLALFQETSTKTMGKPWENNHHVIGILNDFETEESWGPQKWIYEWIYLIHDKLRLFDDFDIVLFGLVGFFDWGLSYNSYGMTGF